MVFYELIITMNLQQDVEAMRGYEYLSRLISSAMLQDEKLKELHESRGLKNYTFSNLYPIEREKVYQRGRIYVWNLRSFDLKLILKIKQILSHQHCGVLAAEVRNFEYRPITQLQTLTPAVITLNGKSWTKEDGLKIVLERAKINALKKYRAFIGSIDEPADTFIEYLTILNERAIKIPYKNNSLLGHKFILGIKSDLESQKLAFAAIGAGFLEKNSIGMGLLIRSEV